MISDEMVIEITQDAEQRMQKSVVVLTDAFKKIRTGRAHPNILDSVMVPYYGTDTQLKQLANVTVEEARTLLITPWEKNMLGEIEKAILRSDLGLNPSNNGDQIRLPMPALTEETRRDFIRQAKAESEHARVAVRNIRRDANSDVKDLLKEKAISEDEERGAEEEIQNITDKYVAEIEKILSTKEAELLSI